MFVLPSGSFVTTSLVGGPKGEQFNDLNLVSMEGNVMLDLNRPITQIRIGSGWVVDGIEMTYQLKDCPEPTRKVLHGSPPERHGNHTINLEESERVTGVFGRAGFQTFYKRDMVNSIGFVIFNQKTGMTRVCGPYGNENKSNNGNAFSVPDMAALSGYAVEAPELGLSGLSFWQSGQVLYSPPRA